MENSTQRIQLLEQLMKAMGQVHRHIATTRDTFLAKFELTRPQIELLFSLKHGHHSTGELAQLFNVSSSAVSQMVDQLAEKSLVERIRDEKDKRITYVQLSKEGAKAFKQIRTHFTQHLNERFVGVTNAELETLLTVVTKITKQIEKEMN